MIVFDLKCEGQGHVFEAWFGSSADYADQKERGLLACPLCGDTRVGKALMAPAVAAGPDEAKMRALVEALADAQKKVLEGSTWVGRGFAEQARAMHYGEQDKGSIHGEVAPAEAKALAEEGINVAQLPFPVIPPEAKN